MASILVHITHGPEHPTRVALGTLVARTALDDGHDVTVFMAGDAVYYIDKSLRAAAQGVGVGSVSEHFDAIQAGGGRFLFSKMSAGARGISEDAIGGLKNAQWGTPSMLVQEALNHDRMFTY